MARITEHRSKLLKQQYRWHFILSAFFILLIIGVTVLVHNKPISISIFTVILLALAVFRLTHLLVYDVVMDFVRDPLTKLNNGLGKSLAQLVHCPWCTSIWMALLVVTLYLLVPSSEIFILVLALAGVAIIIEISARIIWNKADKN